MLIDILKDNTARTPAFGAESALVIPKHPEVAVKTGTSNNFKDNLTFGFNQKYLVAVWVGNNDGSPMNHIVSGVTGAAPIFNRIMTNLLQNQPSIAWDIPDGLVKNLPATAIPSGS
jgi:membrane carboxypeptidase/penicillin-binding protein PbpC